MKIAVFSSGRGSNFEKIVLDKKKYSYEIKLLITNNPDSGSINIAKNNNIPVQIIKKENFSSKEEMNDEILSILKKNNIELVVLAGYMLLLKGKILQDYKHRIINIHPSLLPSFPGLNAQKQAFDYGAKISGLTIHFVDSSLDGGEIIFQKAVDISECNNEEEVSKKILIEEHNNYSRIIDLIVRGKYSINGRFVKIED